MLWQKNLLIPSTLGFRFVAEKLANALLVYGSLEILHCGKKTCSYLLHMRFKFMAKNLANVFWLREFHVVAKKLAVTFYIGVLNLWQKNLLIPSILVYQDLDLWHKNLLMPSQYIGHWKYYIVAKKLANAFLVYRSIEYLDLWQKNLQLLFNLRIL